MEKHQEILSAFTEDVIRIATEMYVPRPTNPPTEPESDLEYLRRTIG